MITSDNHSATKQHGTVMNNDKQTQLLKVVDWYLVSCQYFILCYSICYLNSFIEKHVCFDIKTHKTFHQIQFFTQVFINQADCSKNDHSLNKNKTEHQNK